MNTIKRKGTLELVIIFAMLFLATSASFIFSQLRANEAVADERTSFAEYYNVEALNDIALHSVLNDMCSKTISIPKTPLSNTFTYGENLELIKPAPGLNPNELVANLNNANIAQAFSFVKQNCKIIIRTDVFSANYDNQQNILSFASGDYLALSDVEISITTKTPQACITDSYLIDGLALNIMHSDTQITMQLDDTNMDVGGKIN